MTTQVLAMILAMGMVESAMGQEPRKADTPPSPAPAFAHRLDGEERAKLLKREGGNAESEAAVARGLDWLVRQQKPDGSWVFDGEKKEELAASTAMALMAFLGSGIHPKPPSMEARDIDRSKAVEKGLVYLSSLVGSGGRIDKSSNLYGQAIATVALCEAYGLTGDRDLMATAQRTVDFLALAQGKDGGWRYAIGSDGDICVTGWHVQAVLTATRANLKLPKECAEKASEFLDKVQSERGSKYGYTDAETPSQLRNAIGLRSRQFLNGWGPGTVPLILGVDAVVTKGLPERGMDTYYGYYATQLVHDFGGPAWHSKWNPAMRDLLVSTQHSKHGKDKHFGSWNADGQSIGTHCGRLGTTCMNLLTLEVYYRYKIPESPRKGK